MQIADGPGRTEGEATTVRGTGEGQAESKFAQTMSGQLFGMSAFFSRFTEWRRRRFLTLRAKIVIVITSIGVGLLLVASVFTILNFEHNVDAEARAHVNVALGVFNQAVVRTRSFNALVPVMDAVSGSPVIASVAIGTTRGDVLAYEGRRPVDYQMLASHFVEAGRIFAGEDRRGIKAVGSTQDDLQDFAVPVTLPGDGAHSVAIFRIDMRQIKEAHLVSAISMMSWLIVVIIVSILTISLIVHRVVITPIEALSGFAGRKQPPPLPAGGMDDEISLVARALSDAFADSDAKDQMLRKLASTDGLTSLGNRRWFKDVLAEAIAEHREDRLLVGVLVLNIDKFKDVNDTLGHDAGDRLLQRTADILKSCTRDGDKIARIGGDEFGLILPGLHSADEALDLAYRFSRAVGAPLRLGPHELQPSSSVGITLFPQDGRDPDTLLKNADLALTRAKLEGSGICLLYRHELQLRAIERNSIERDLRAAIRHGDLELFYQPKVEISTGLIAGAEALVRWRHPERGYIPPDVFIPVAEKSGFIGELTKWVMDEACRQIRHWQDIGLTRVAVAVNVSAGDLRRPDLTDMIANTLVNHGVSPQYLELEVTESMVMQDVDMVIGTLRRLRSLGIGISIDDFGTGYSSLAYLKRFPVKRLKIDRSFVRDLGSHGEGRVIPKVIVDLAHALSVKVVAEGVETAEQLQALAELGCDEAQGYFLGRPMPRDEFEAFLQNSPAAQIPQGEQQDSELARLPSIGGTAA